MNILAIDSGLERTGFAVFSKSSNSQQLLASGRIFTKKSDQIQIRIEKIYNDLHKIILKYRIKIIVLERLFFLNNQKTAISVSQTQGVVLLLSAQHNISIDFLTPLQIKEIVTGYGHSDKLNVQKMLNLSLGITSQKNLDDESDAIACGLAYCYLHKNSVK